MAGSWLDSPRMHPKFFFPVLDDSKHKGENGKICVIGGSREYTGAPFYSAMASLRTGADLAYILTTESAAPALKCYSPDVIVYPSFSAGDEPSGKFEQFIGGCEVIEKCDAVILGPGLGTDVNMAAHSMLLLEICKRQEKFLVIDADGLRALISQDSFHILKDYRKCLLTPNLYEAKLLVKAVCKKGIVGDLLKDLITMCNKLGGPSVFLKGAIDHMIQYIPNNSKIWKLPVEHDFGCKSMLSPVKRCGGQGDILDGILATMMVWVDKMQSLESIKSSEDKKQRELPSDEAQPLETYHDSPELEADRKLLEDNQTIFKPFLTFPIAAFLATSVMKLSAYSAFKMMKRGMVASDIISQIPVVVTKMEGMHEHTMAVDMGSDISEIKVVKYNPKDEEKQML